MKEFIQVLKRFIPPYKKYLVLTVLFNILSALLNIFSFMAIIPILNILFQTEGTMEPVTWIPWSEMTLGNISEVLSNNANSLVQEMVTSLGPTTTMLASDGKIDCTFVAIPAKAICASTAEHPANIVTLVGASVFAPG